ncbi:unnamed protein product [Diplocarpon coronariae]
MQSFIALFTPLFAAAIAFAIGPTVEFMNVADHRRAKVVIPLNINTSLPQALYGTPIQYKEKYLATWAALLHDAEGVRCNITYPDFDNRFFVLELSTLWTSFTLSQNTIELNKGMIRCESSSENGNTD